MSVADDTVGERGPRDTDDRRDDGRRGGSRSRISLIVRNIPLDMTVQDVRSAFEKFGHVRDVVRVLYRSYVYIPIAIPRRFCGLQYMPPDYHTRKPRGFAFVEFTEEAAALEAKSEMDRSDLGGREITVGFAEERRKNPDEMRARDRMYYIALVGLCGTSLVQQLRIVLQADIAGGIPLLLAAAAALPTIDDDTMMTDTTTDDDEVEEVAVVPTIAIAAARDRIRDTADITVITTVTGTRIATVVTVTVEIVIVIVIMIGIGSGGVVEAVIGIAMIAERPAERGAVHPADAAHHHWTRVAA